MSLTAHLGMLRRWAGWAWRAVKLALGLLLGWVAGSMLSVLVGPDLGRWFAPAFAVAAVTIWVGVVISREPLRSLTISRPRVARNKHAHRSHRWIRRNWEAVCEAIGLAGFEPPGGGQRLYPRVKRIEMGPRGPIWTVEILVTNAQAQTPGLWVRRADELGSILGCPVEITALDARMVRIELLTREASKSTAFVPLEEQVDLRGPLTIGTREDGTPFRFPFAEKQTLLVGASGSGKGSVIASTLAALGPAIRDGLVTVDAIDLKGGVEAGAYAGLLRTSAWDYESAHALLAELTRELDERLTEMRTKGLRKSEPSVSTPLRLLIIDEAASLTYLAPDAKTRNAVDQLLKRILSTGRAAGYVVLAALQDPRKEALASRDLYTQTIALRFRTKDDAVLAIGQSAYDAGARCELIPTSAPGTGYAIDSETGEVVRFRAFWVSDADLKEMTRLYAPLEREERP